MTSTDGVTTVTGIGSWPGSDQIAAQRAVVDRLTDHGCGVAGVVHLAETPARGPGADMVGRAAALLVDLPCDVQPHGWRLTSGSGHDQRRARNFLRSDLDDVSEVLDGFTGTVKIQVCGPWTAVANVWLPRGELVIADSGAVRDVQASLAEGVSNLVTRVRQSLPGCDVVVQLDEPSLPSVLAGRLESVSKLRRLAPVPTGVVLGGLASCAQQVRDAGAVEVVAHSCAPALPWARLHEAQLSAWAVDTSVLSGAELDGVAEAVHSGVAVWWGLSGLGTQSVNQGVEFLQRWCDRLSLTSLMRASLTLTPSCGFAHHSPKVAQDSYRHLVRLAEAWSEKVAGG